MKNKLHNISTLLDVTARPRQRTLLASLVLVQAIALPLLRASDAISPEKFAGDHTARPVPPTEQRASDKSATPTAVNPGTDKKAAGPVSSGLLPPGLEKADKQSATMPAARSVRSATDPAANPVSGPASAEDLKNYQKAGGNSAAPSVLVLPVSAPAPGAGKVAVGPVTGPASPEEYGFFVKPAILPGVAPEPVRAPTSGTVPPAEQRHFQK